MIHLIDDSAFEIGGCKKTQVLFLSRAELAVPRKIAQLSLKIIAQEMTICVFKVSISTYTIG